MGFLVVGGVLLLLCLRVLLSLKVQWKSPQVSKNSSNSAVVWIISIFALIFSFSSLFFRSLQTILRALILWAIVLEENAGIFTFTLWFTEMARSSTWFKWFHSCSGFLVGMWWFFLFSRSQRILVISFCKFFGLMAYQIWMVTQFNMNHCLHTVSNIGLVSLFHRISTFIPFLRVLVWK